MKNFKERINLNANMSVMKNVNWKNMVKFMYFAEFGGFREAAKATGIDPGSIYRSVKLFEHEVKEILFTVRNAHSSLTPAGKKWYRHIREMNDRFATLMRGQQEPRLPTKEEARLQALALTDQMQEFLHQMDSSKDYNFTMITLHSKKENMKNIKICCASHPNAINMALNKLIHSPQFQDYTFSIGSVEESYLPEDCDVRIIHFEHDSPNFFDEKIVETKFDCWASSSYIEKHGIPKSIDDLKNHTIVKPGKSDAFQNIGRQSIPFVNLSFGKKIVSDTGYDFVELADQGIGIMCLNSKANTFRANNLEKLSEICETPYTSFHFQAHKASKDDPFVLALKKEYIKVMHCNSLTEAETA